MQIILIVNVARLLWLLWGPAAQNGAKTEGKTSVHWEENGMRLMQKLKEMRSSQIDRICRNVGKRDEQGGGTMQEKYNQLTL